MTTRYQLSAHGNHIDKARTRSGAFTKAIFFSKRSGIRVHVLDRLAHRQHVDLWELRPFEMFPRALRVKVIN